MTIGSIILCFSNVNIVCYLQNVMTNRKEGLRSAEQIITETTNSYLKLSLEKLIARRGELLSLGTDYTSGLHDDPAVVREMQQLDQGIDKINSVLKNSLILEPRFDTSKIGIGNRIKIKFEDDGSRELYRFGTAIDASYSSDEIPWISVESPLGRELNDKKRWDLISYKLGFVNKQIQILDILSER